MADIHINTPEEIEGMRRVGRKASELLDFITPYVKAGVTTLALDKLMLEYTVDELKCKSACLNYAPKGCIPYPAATCISPNHVICHGIPSEKKVLKNGDIVNIDITIVAQRPKISPFTAAMRERIAEALGIAAGQVSIKGKTTEGMGFCGRGEGVETYATVLLERK